MQVAERVSRASGVEQVVIASTDQWQDRPIVLFGRDNHLLVFRGSEEDVLGRVTKAAQLVKADIIVDITGDCPLIDRAHIDHIVESCHAGHSYASNVNPRSWPDGFDVQAYSIELLEHANEVVVGGELRSHVGWNIANLIIGEEYPNYSATSEFAYPKWGLTLDTQADLRLLKIIFEYFGHNHFTAEDVISFLKRCPELLEVNKRITRKKAGEG